MRIVEINAVPTGSTGHIMLNIANLVEEQGGETRMFYTPIYTQKYIKIFSFHNHHVKIGNHLENSLHATLGQITGLNGLFSYFGTKKLIKICKEFKPDIIHLHVLHAFCFCLPTLFRYIKKHNIPVVWTFHDCWTFTGHCPHFTMVNCDKWKTGCGKCPQLGCYPKARTDTTKLAYKLKRKWFTGVKNMTIVTPSEWLADLTRQSFMKENHVKVINNGINLEIFKPTESDFKEKYNIDEKKKIILGVASGWGNGKGLDVFVELAKRLDADKYQIVLVGTNDSTDKKLPDGIISIHRTESQKELAQIYTAADLFVNPTREDTYPTVNMESIACGTPVLTFNTGGSPELVDNTCGSVVNCDDIDALEKEIIRICGRSPYSKEACINKAKDFDMNDRFKEYVELYEQIKG